CGLGCGQGRDWGSGMGCGQGGGDGCGPCCNQGRGWGGQGLDCGLDGGLGCGTRVADQAALPAHRSRPVTWWKFAARLCRRVWDLLVGAVLFVVLYVAVVIGQLVTGNL